MNYLYIVIFIIIIMLGVLSYLILTSTKSNPSKPSLSATELALQKARIVGTQENFAFDGVYNNLEDILSNFEDFINTYFPKINLGKINDLLKSYNIHFTIQNIMENNKPTNIHNSIASSLYFSLIKYDDNKQELGNLALIGIILLYNIYLNDSTSKYYKDLRPLNPYFSYNTDYKTTNELRLYFNTDNNKDTEHELVAPHYLMNSAKCINNNLCYTILDKILELDENSSDIIKNNYNDIENFIYINLIHDIRDYLDISEEIKQNIETGYVTIITKIRTIDYKFAK